MMKDGSFEGYSTSLELPSIIKREGVGQLLFGHLVNQSLDDDLMCS